MKLSSISVVPSVVPSQFPLSQAPRKDDEESVFAFAAPSLSPPPPNFDSLVTSTPQPTHAGLPTLTPARPHSKCSQRSMLTTCNVPIIPNRLSTSVSPPSSPFPVSPRLSSFHASTGQTETSQPESSQLHEYLPPFQPYCSPQVVDTVNDPSDPDPVGRIWRQERDIAHKERIAPPSRVCKLSLLQPIKRVPTIMAQTEAPPDSFIDASPAVPINSKQLWIPSFPDAKTPNHRLADPGPSQLRRRDFLGSTDPIITSQVIAAETASVRGDLPDVDGCPTIASKVKFWIPDIHSSPFAAARSFATISSADITSEAGEGTSQGIDTTVTLGKLDETPDHQQNSILDCRCEVAECLVHGGPESSDGPQVS